MIAFWESLYGEVKELHYSHIMEARRFRETVLQNANRLFELLKRGFVIDEEWACAKNTLNRKDAKAQSQRKGRCISLR